jgi:uncharacterized protein (TIGR02271 family)
MKAKLVIVLCGATFLFTTACATNYKTAGHEDRRRGRVDRQWAHESGLIPPAGHYQHVKGPDTGGVGYVTPLPDDPGTPHVGQPVQDGGGSGVMPPSQPPVMGGGDVEIQLCQEELVVGKRTVNNGAVLIRKVVKSEPASETVDLKREEYVIERIPGMGRNDADCFTDKQIVLCLTKEEAVVGTRVKQGATELVRVRKVTHNDRQQVSGTIRKETLEVTKLADCPTNTPPRIDK